MLVSLSGIACCTLGLIIAKHPVGDGDMPWPLGAMRIQDAVATRTVRDQPLCIERAPLFEGFPNIPSNPPTYSSPRKFWFTGHWKMAAANFEQRYL